GAVVVAETVTVFGGPACGSPVDLPQPATQITASAMKAGAARIRAATIPPAQAGLCGVRVEDRCTHPPRCVCCPPHCRIPALSSAGTGGTKLCGANLVRLGRGALLFPR